ncbi:MAG TPA: L-threonylcarbamoyladenylate synthase, partial [Eoetvoesiella sp.]
LAPQANIDYWVRSVPQEARVLITEFWPGPLTLILPRARHIPAAVSGGQDSVGLRCPSHPVAQALLREFARLKPNGEGGVAGPSANKFGQVSPTRAEHVRAEFSDLGSDQLIVLEGGQSEVGIESTIVDLSRLDQGVGPVLLRPGHISARQISQVLGVDVDRPDSAAPRVSGSLKAHYAPRTPLALLARDQLLQQLAHASSPSDSGLDPEKIAAVVFIEPSVPVSPCVDYIVASSDPHAYARNLYALLRRLDSGGYARILIERPPQDAAWQAVNDRIGRAAAAFN